MANDKQVSGGVEEARVKTAAAGEAIAPEAVAHSIEALEEYGGFDLIAGSVEGGDNLEPDSIMKEIFLEEDSNKRERKALKQRLQEWIGLLTEVENVGEMIEQSTARHEAADALLKANLSKTVERISDLEKNYRAVANFYRNAAGDKPVKNVTLVNAPLDKLNDLDNPIFLKAIGNELQEKFDRLDLMNSYGLVVVPGFLGSKAVVDEWARTAQEAKTMLLTDFRDLANPDQVMRLFEAGKYTGADEHKGNVMMTCNWLVGRPAYEELGEAEPLYVAPSTALAGRLYNNNIAQVSAGKKFGVLRGVEGTRFVTRANELSDLGELGLVPMAFEYGQVQAFSQRTLFNGDNLGMQTYSVVRTFDWLTKSLMDYLNRMLFINISTNAEMNIHKEVAKFFFTCQKNGILEKYGKVEIKRDPNQKDRVWVKVHATPFFPARNFVINLEGKSGDDPNSPPDWESNVE
ncbi:type VI secretion system contractile sheath protein TssC [Lewinella sp. IMCC34183]|uniref:type VI secretion system contractile sheath protein TssC n=1 Tax=Lewinella sp. IMCC34183 TaxID=2248762 RepID=UPI000E256B04|nr:type VI secretion system contractile sheath protein TssC [Lewinella sp. IMCC34183]